MNEVALAADMQDIVVDAVLPHRPELIWKALTEGEMIARWLRMMPTGFAPVVGTQFTYQTTAKGEWDGTIQCKVLEAVPHERLVYTWKSGHKDNVGYGSQLDTIVTFILTKVSEGTRLRVIHSGFVLPRNETAYTNMSKGWQGCFPHIGAAADKLQ